MKGGKFELVFYHLDENGDGKISPLELARRLGLLGDDGSLSVKEAEVAVESFDSDGDGYLGPEDLLGLMDSGEEEDKLKELKAAFGMYDVENCGFITPKNLRRMLRRLGDSKSIEECKLMISRFDIDGDGVLSFEEFKIMMM